MFDAKSIKELRERTGAGMLDCKMALTETKGDLEKAVDFLREKGIAKAAKKESRIAAEGLAKVFIKDNKAVILEVNTETDFVSKNAKFLDFFDQLGNLLLANDVKTVEELLEVKFDGNETVNEHLTHLIATIGEKISIRRFEVLNKDDAEVFGEYIHMGGRIAVLNLIKGGNAEVATDVAMQAAAMRPKYTSVEDITEEDREREEHVISEQIKNEGKPADIAAKMLIGRMQKFFKEVCLLEQAFIKDDKVNVQNYLKNNGAELLKSIRFEVGEGMEKRCDDFAAEVREQMGA